MDWTSVMAMKHKMKWLFSFVVLLNSGCNTPEPLGIAKPVASNCTEADLDDRFFRGVFSGKNEFNLADARGLSELLSSLGEPSLSCDVKADETYRLTYKPEHGDAFTIRAQRLENAYNVISSSITTRDATPRPTYQPLAPQSWEHLIRVMNGYNFWSRSPYPTPSTINSKVIVVHGPVWLLEGQRGGWYHAVSRESSFKEFEFDVPARTMFEIAGLEVPGVVKPRD